LNLSAQQSPADLLTTALDVLGTQNP
jgi:hypothetical protein